MSEVTITPAQASTQYGLQLSTTNPTLKITTPTATGGAYGIQATDSTTPLSITISATDTNKYIIDGGLGNDQVDGGPLDDIVRLGAGSDVLRGNAGNDNLNPGTGKDIVVGGAGKDTIDFTAGAFGNIRRGIKSKGRTFANAAERDAIQDFSPTDGDVIRISKAALPGSKFKTKIGNILDKNDFAVVRNINELKSDKVKAPLVYNSGNGILYYNPRKGTEVALVELPKGLDLTNSNFTIT